MVVILKTKLWVSVVWVKFSFCIKSDTLVAVLVIGALFSIVGKDWIISLFQQRYPRYAAAPNWAKLNVHFG